MMSNREGLELLWALNAHWPSFSPGDGDQLRVRVTVWVDTLAEFTQAQALAAVAVLARSGREFAPTPGQVAQALDAASGSLAPDADAALAEVHAQVRRVGYVGTPVWSHPAIGAAVAALGGWADVCASTNPEAFRAHFRQLYGSAAERQDREATTPPAVAELLAGLAGELANEQRAIGTGS